MLYQKPAILFIPFAFVLSAIFFIILLGHVIAAYKGIQLAIKSETLTNALIIILILFSIGFGGLGIYLFYHPPEITWKQIVGFIFSIFILFGSSGLFYFSYTNLINVSPSAAKHFNFDVSPYLTYSGDPQKEICITWFTTEPSQTKLEYKLATDDNWTAISSNDINDKKPDGLHTKHQVILTNLKPGSIYNYRILNNPNIDTNKSFQFKTAPQIPQEGTNNYESTMNILKNFSFNVVVFGDSQNGGGTKEGVFAQLVDSALNNPETNGAYDLILHVGDFVDQGNDLKSWAWELQQLSKISANTPFQSAAGNHDLGDKHRNDNTQPYYPDQGANWFYFLNYPYVNKNKRYPLTSMKPHYYSYRYGHAQFIAIDSEVLADFQPETPQLQWLENELTRANSDPTIRWIIAYLHRPLFSQYEGEQSKFDYFHEKYDHFKFLAPLFDKYGVDIVLEGHVHDYQAYKWEYNSSVPFYNPNDNWDHHEIYYFVTGGAANDFNQNEEYSAKVPFFLGGQHTDHYMTIQVSWDQCKIQAWYVDNSLVLGNQTFVIKK